MLYNLFENRDFVSVFAVALLAEGVDRNFLHGLWYNNLNKVALLAEGVDRNTRKIIFVLRCAVALLAEGVDRNMQQLFAMQMQQVALLAEGVDRNRAL